MENAKRGRSEGWRKGEKGGVKRERREEEIRLQYKQEKRSKVE